jgi:hypothetical protein
LDPNEIGREMIKLQNEGKVHTDDKLWYPINQVWMLMSKWGRNDFKNTSKISESSGFQAWGDYGERSDVGFIHQVKFQDAVDVYLTSGKSIEILIAWVRNNFLKFNSKTKDYLDDWLNGDVYYDKPKNGNIKDEGKSKPITYGGTSTEQSPGAGNDDGENTSTRTTVLNMANFLKAYKIPGWLSTHRPDLGGNFQCDRFARVLSAAIGTFGGVRETNLQKDQWIGEDFKVTVHTKTLKQFETAFAHWENVSSGKQNKDWFTADSEKGKNPPAGWIVYWSGGADSAGHNGVSVGGGEYVDQHTSNERPSPRAISFEGFPGSSYTYLGCSSVWSVSERHNA